MTRGTVSFRWLLFVAAMVLTAMAHADLFKCMVGGATTFQDHPCTEGAQEDLCAGGGAEYQTDACADRRTPVHQQRVGTTGPGSLPTPGPSSAYSSATAAPPDGGGAGHPNGGKTGVRGYPKNDGTNLLQVLIGFWWVIPLLVVIWLFKAPIVKGYLGEVFVRLAARLRLDKSIYHRVDNVTLRTLDGTTQIDHVFVSRYGVFALETKNMKGWIFGSADEAQWTQKFSRQSFRFQNPLRQNYKHIKALEAALELPAGTVHSVVTFVGAARFKTPMPPNVTVGAGFVGYIKSFREQAFTANQVDELLGKLRSRRLAPTLETHRAHVAHLQSRSDPNAQRTCPQCGNPLVLRTGTSGARAGERFWGCSAYPKCRVVQELG